MVVDVGLINSLASNLGAFIVDETKIGLMPRGIDEDGDVDFANPIVTSVQIDSRWTSAIKWKDCGVEPIVGLEQSNGGSNVAIDNGINRSADWNAMGKALDGILSGIKMDTESMSRNGVTKKAREENKAAMDAEAAASKVQASIDAAERVSRAANNSSDDMTWRTAKYSLNAVADVRGNAGDVASIREQAVDHLLKSGFYYLMAGVVTPAAEALYRASGNLFALERHAKAAILAEAAWQMDRRSHDDWASFAVAAWSRASRGSSNKAFELSHALRIAWSAKKWGHYSNAIEFLNHWHEDGGDYAAIAADYLRTAWALLQEEKVGRADVHKIVSCLEEASLAWELAERDNLAKKTTVIADQAKKCESILLSAGS